MRSYETSRVILGIAEFASWAAIVIGAIAALIAGSAAAKYSGFGAPSFFALALPGIVVATLGLFGVVQCQLARAGVDTAELTGQILKVGRDQLEVSRDALRKTKAGDASFAALASKAPEIESPIIPKAGYATAAASREREETDALPPTTETSAFKPFDEKFGLTQLNEAATEFEYRDRKLQLTDGMYYLNGIAFPSAKAAKSYIDKLAIPVK